MAKRSTKKVDAFIEKNRASVSLDGLRAMLKRRPRTLEEMAGALGNTPGEVLDACGALRKAGANVHQYGSLWSIETTPAKVEDIHMFKSDAKGHYRFGVISDTHLGSKYQRLDVCEELYDVFVGKGVKAVLHGGNMIEGEARFNRADLLPEAHGMQAQIDYFVEHYPRRSGITTYFVAGDDHEGWYAQREGVDIGRMIEDAAVRAGRNDLRYVGYMEAFFTLQHRRSGKTAKLLLMHPGGGSAYALSYAPQKTIEAFQPGEKPGCVIFGHWHKMEFANIRGVWSVQAGCTKDLDVFGRKKRLSYHVGGVVLDLMQDEGGALVGCRPDFRQWFDRDYYNGQFDMARVPVKRRAPHGKKP